LYTIKEIRSGMKSFYPSMEGRDLMQSWIAWDLAMLIKQPKFWELMENGSSMELYLV